MAVTVLMLQSFPVECRAPSGGAEQKPFCFAVGRRPDQVADSLKAKHRIVKIERDQIDSQVSVSCSRGDKRGHGTRFGDPFFENLSVLDLMIIKQGLAVDRFVQLALRCVNTELAKQRIHAESASFV